MTQHTQGPWEVTDNSWETSTVYDAAGNVVAVCQISSDATEETQEHFEAIKDANARLIAAAPELLEALKVAEDSVGDLKSLEIVRAAIAKATGAA